MVGFFHNFFFVVYGSFFNHQSFCHQLCFFHYTVCFFLHLQDYFTVKKKSMTKKESMKQRGCKARTAI